MFTAANGTPLWVQQAAWLASNARELVEPCATVECHSLVSSGEKLYREKEEKKQYQEAGAGPRANTQPSH